MKELTLVTQPTHNTCTSACIAMITELPIDQVIEEFHTKYINHHITLHGYLRVKGVSTKMPVEKPSFPAPLSPGHLYILTVPSLNEEGMFHNIVVDYRWGEKPHVLDPCEGKKNHKYYDNYLTGDLAVPLKSWIVEAVVYL